MTERFAWRNKLDKSIPAIYIFEGLMEKGGSS
jgi:hypothetical protein